MNTSTIKIYSRVFLLFFFSVLLSYASVSWVGIPTEGDSLAYHIPIAKSVLNFRILHPDFYLGFYPASAETILAFFYLLHIPPNLFNVLAILLLFLVSKRLAIVFGMNKTLASAFAVTVCCLPTMLRWASAQIIDIWLLVFYVWALSLLEKPEKSFRYFLLLGLALGLLVGAKFSGPLFAVGLFVFYIQRIRPLLTFRNVVIIGIPFLLTGLSWYIRNAIVMHNPIYPQPIFSLPGKYDWTIFDYHEWQIILLYPIKSFNAFFAEYLLWFVSPLVSIVWWILDSRKLHLLTDNKRNESFLRLLFLGSFNYIVFLFLPTTPEYNIIVSSIRYSYPCFIVFMLLIFLFSERYKRQELLLMVSFSGLLFLPQLSYRPKLLAVFFMILGGYLMAKKAIIRR